MAYMRDSTGRRLDDFHVQNAGIQLYNATALRPFTARLGGCLTARLNISAVGHSIVFGKGSAGINTETDAQAAEPSWAGRLRQKFVREYGIDPGEGWMKLDDSRITNSGSTSAPNTSLLAKGRRLQSGQTLTIPLTACTDIDIMIWKNSSTSTGVPTYSLDGGADVIPAQPAVGDNYFPSISLTGLSDTPHTIVLKGPASGSAYVSAVQARRGNSGVAVHRLGIAGAVLADLSSPPGGAAQKATVRRAVTEGTTPQLLIIECETNDQGAQTSVAAWAADMQLWIDAASAVGCPLLMLGDPRKDGASGAITEDDYADAAVALTESNDNAAYLRISDWWGSFAQAEALGLYHGGSTVHPSAQGHGDIDNMLFNVLTGRFTPLVMVGT